MRYKKFFITLIAILVMTTIWLFAERQNGGNNIEYRYDNLARIEISALPKDIYQSLAIMEEQARKKFKGDDSSSFSLDILSINKKHYITTSTPLILQTYYNRSKKMVQRVTYMPKAFVGLTVDDLKSISQTWEVKDFSPDHSLILYREIDDLSPEDKNTLHLGVKDGKVAIFYGRRGERFLKQKTEINANDLPVQERERLKTGIQVKSQEELLTILEGLKSYRED